MLRYPYYYYVTSERIRVNVVNLRRVMVNSWEILRWPEARRECQGFS